MLLNLPPAEPFLRVLAHEIAEEKKEQYVAEVKQDRADQVALNNLSPEGALDAIQRNNQGLKDHNDVSRAKHIVEERIARRDGKPEHLPTGYATTTLDPNPRKESNAVTDGTQVANATGTPRKSDIDYFT